MAPKLDPEVLEARKVQILQAALVCFAEKGYHQTTMDDIVQQAALSKGGVYWHFESKKALFLELVKSMFAGAGAYLEDPPGDTAAERLRAALESTTALLNAEQAKLLIPLMLEMWGQNLQDPDVNAFIVQMYDQIRAPLARLIEDGIAAGEFKPVDARVLASMLAALYDGLMVQWTIEPGAVRWDAVARALNETFVAGLLATSA